MIFHQTYVLLISCLYLIGTGNCILEEMSISKQSLHNLFKAMTDQCTDISMSDEDMRQFLLDNGVEDQNNNLNDEVVVQIALLNFEEIKPDGSKHKVTKTKTYRLKTPSNPSSQGNSNVNPKLALVQRKKPKTSDSIQGDNAKTTVQTFAQGSKNKVDVTTQTSTNKPTPAKTTTVNTTTEGEPTPKVPGTTLAPSTLSEGDVKTEKNIRTKKSPKKPKKPKKTKNKDDELLKMCRELQRLHGPLPRECTKKLSTWN